MLFSQTLPDTRSPPPPQIPAGSCNLHRFPVHEINMQLSCNRHKLRHQIHPCRRPADRHQIMQAVHFLFCYGWGVVQHCFTKCCSVMFSLTLARFPTPQHPRDPRFMKPTQTQTPVHAGSSFPPLWLWPRRSPALLHEVLFSQALPDICMIPGSCNRRKLRHQFIQAVHFLFGYGRGEVQHCVTKCCSVRLSLTVLA